MTTEILPRHLELAEKISAEWNSTGRVFIGQDAQKQANDKFAEIAAKLIAESEKYLQAIINNQRGVISEQNKIITDLALRKPEELTWKT